MARAGQIIRAIDTPASVYFRQGTPDNGFSSTSMDPTDPECSGTFVAATSGKAEIIFSLRWDPPTTADRIEADVQVRENDSSGTIIHAAQVEADGAIDIEGATGGSTFHDNQPGWAYVTGMTPGGLYFCRLHIHTDGGAFDIEDQSILIKHLR